MQPGAVRLTPHGLFGSRISGGVWGVFLHVAGILLVRYGMGWVRYKSILSQGLDIVLELQSFHNDSTL